MHLDRRRLLTLPLALALATPVAAACHARTVLFVCPAGTVKSAIARETLRRRAAAKGLALDVRSRGITPEDHVSPELARRLRADGIDPATQPARAVTAADVAGADVVVAFDAAAEAPVMKGARSWATPSWNADYDKAKADLDQRLDGLLAEVAEGCR